MVCLVAVNVTAVRGLSPQCDCRAKVNCSEFRGVNHRCQTVRWTFRDQDGREMDSGSPSLRVFSASSPPMMTCCRACSKEGEHVNRAWRCVS